MKPSGGTFGSPGCGSVTEPATRRRFRAELPSCWRGSFRHRTRLRRRCRGHRRRILYLVRLRRGAARRVRRWLWICAYRWSCPESRCNNKRIQLLAIHRHILLCFAAEFAGLCGFDNEVFRAGKPPVAMRVQPFSRMSWQFISHPFLLTIRFWPRIIILALEVIKRLQQIRIAILDVLYNPWAQLSLK